MSIFYKTDVEDQWATVRSAGRLMYADLDSTFPGRISDLLFFPSMNARSDWTDLGATKGGINMQGKAEREVISLNQATGEIEANPTQSTFTVGTDLAQATLKNLLFAMNAEGITTTGGLYPSLTTFPAPDQYPGRVEQSSSFGLSRRNKAFRLAILYRNMNNEKIRAIVFRKAKLIPNTQFTFHKEGDQQTIPIELTSLPDFTIADVKKRNFVIIEQI